MLHQEAQKTSELNAVLQQQVGDLHAELEQLKARRQHEIEMGLLAGDPA